MVQYCMNFACIQTHAQIRECKLLPYPPTHSYTHTQNRVLPERWVYAASLAPFLAYYALFAGVLYPLSAHIHPTHLLDSLRTALPQGEACKGWDIAP